jgi:rod shape-determining protein MreD
MTKKVIWTTLFIIAAAILQSTLLSPLSVYLHAKPDIALDILVFSAYLNGVMVGQLSGFFSGLFMDFLSNSPLGLNLFVRTIIGAVSGFINGSFMVDTIFLPILLCSSATLLKAAILIILNILFAGVVPAYSLTAPTLWLELAMNSALAPLIFALLKMFNKALSKRRPR